LTAKDLLKPANLLAVRGCPEPIVANLVNTAGQDMLEEPANELLGGKGERFWGPAIAIGVTECHGTCVDGDDSTVGDRDAMNVAGQVVQNGVGPLDGGLAVDDPVLRPDGRRDAKLWEGVEHHVLEDATEDPGKGSDRQQVVLACRQPLAFGGQTASGDEAVDMRMVGERSRPGMQDGQDTDQPADIVRVCRELDQGVGGGLHEEGVQSLLVTPDDVAKFLGQGEDDVKVGYGQEFLTAFVEPSLDVIAMALGATAVSAGVVGVVLFSTVRAGKDLATQDGGPAVQDVLECVEMAGQHPLTVLGKILPAVLAEDVGDFKHDRPGDVLEVGHQVADRGVYGLHGGGSQMGVDECRLDATVAQEGLNDPEVQTSFQ
jgi:hypothetical protein